MLASNFKKQKKEKCELLKKFLKLTTTLTKKLTMSNLREWKIGYMGKPSGCIGLASIFDYDFLAKKYSDFLASTFSWDISYLKLKSN